MIFANKDYRLLSSSAFKNKGTNGKDIGADIDSIAIASNYQCNTPTRNIDQRREEKIFVVFPNPASSHLFIQSNSHNSNSSLITLFDLSGRSLLSTRLNIVDHSIDVSNLKSGIYFVKIITDSHAEIHKIMVEH